MNTIPFARIENTDLEVGMVYEGGNAGNMSDDPLSKLLKAGNSGRFRYCGSVANLNYLTINVSRNDQKWPDRIETDSATLICFGDKKKPGPGIHKTPKKGNLILKNIFRNLHSRENLRDNIPPLFLFSKWPTQNSPRSVRFRGVCAPGSPHYNAKKDLTRVWRQSNKRRVQNYRAIFTILDIPVISRKWINDLEANLPDSNHRPLVWKMWQTSGLYRPLKATSIPVFRPVQDQLPKTDLKKAMLFKLYRYFSLDPYKFIFFAADIYGMAEARTAVDRIVRHASDGEYNAVGHYRMGLRSDPIAVEFILEAKCYNPGIGNRKRKSIGVKEIKRLMSRINKRRLGVMVTTSIVAKQAYQEARRQKYPIIFICGVDIVDVLISKGVDTVKQLNDWLIKTYPIK
jgi:hypothetical protein